MRVATGQKATMALVLAGLAVLVIAGRVLPTPPSGRQHAAATPTSAPAPTSGAVRLPDLAGRTLSQAQQQLGAADLQGLASPHDPQTSDALVVAQEPPAGTLIPPGSVVGLRTRTDLQPNGASRRLALERGPATARYPIIALDPTSHELTVVVRVPPNTDLEVWLQPVPGDHLHVVASTRRDTTCQTLDRQVSCWVSIGALPNEPSGAWTTHVLKRSSPPANVEITVTFAPP
jgi:PASTA domain